MSALVLAALLAVICVVIVASPFLVEPVPEDDSLRSVGAAEQRLVDAIESRDRALAALKELEADHRAGRVTDDDYRAAVGPLRQEAAASLRALDEAREGMSGRSAKISG
ncbi:MAG: hypothetical protein U0R50_11930 [Gaiellales bacterium]